MLFCEKVAEAREYIEKKTDIRPEFVVVLGSGLGRIAEKMADTTVFSYEDIPYWPRSTAPGHAGKLIFGHICGHTAVVMQGRVHYYEGYTMEEVTFPIRVLGELGVKAMVATNASGGIGSVSDGISPGTIVIVNDHINYMGTNPLIGENIDKWGVRFPDMTAAYDREFINILTSVAKKNNLKFSSGVYIAFSGPSYETPAEIRMARTMGASVVGMSTVPEVIVANHMGIRTAVLSCVANYAAGIQDAKLSEKEVLDEMQKISDSLYILITEFLKEVRI